jgi:hypothetical protein
MALKDFITGKYAVSPFREAYPAWMTSQVPPPMTIDEMVMDYVKHCQMPPLPREPGALEPNGFVWFAESSGVFLSAAVLPDNVFRLIEPTHNAAYFPTREEAMRAYEAAVKALNAADVTCS